MQILRSLLLSVFLVQSLCTANFPSGSIFEQSETLSSTQDPYMVLEHEAFPHHSVRIKPVKGFCDPTVNSYAGYIDMGARHLFFYYFESRNEPAKDDVILWLNGGPGASASLGLFFELGPCKIISDTETVYNKHSWNSNSNMLFIDQPVGVAFSYAEYGETVGVPSILPESPMGVDMFLFFAAEVYDQNRRLVQEGMTPLNLVSIMLGNGCSDRYHTITSYHDMQCSTFAGPPIQSISVCTQMKLALPRCQQALRTHCEDTFDMINCRAAQSFCADMLQTPFELTGKSVYDMRTECIGEVRDTLCYPATKQIANYLNLPSTRATLGIDLSYPNISMVGWAVNEAFSASGDVHKSSTLYIAALLDHGVRVLIYAGTYDLACNFVANDRVARELEWYGQRHFSAQPLHDWIVDGQPAGETRAFGGLTFATLRDAGHQAPYDRPVEALALINRWLADVPL
ncbi:Carboxypeptidase [Mycena venus]|uniref:carboxypeptidase C n=1 Tax=Mycena venus TaxID=2733690 RepID=A0A8H6Y8I9_9AGAR|nr:Carboxypeptidase [Mycena venus]